ncbi:jg9459 [Pararge aegeria aegeria]|uniref:Jg9459 protein n=1 Tax=Pararge aegeria aegeria TaxID=348720 RepID=A0A8S4RHS4_9NEOP|nr:jg9459 [Pararge aegeria aegeria]
MSKAIPDEVKSIEFDSILPDSGFLFYEECPSEYEIDKPILLPLKSTTQTRFEQLQQEAVQVWKEKQKTAKNNA